LPLRNQRVPLGGLDIGPDLPRWIDGGAERDNLLFQPDLHPLKRHLRTLREFQFDIVEPAAEQRTVLQLRDQRVDALGGPRHRAVDALMRQQHAALQAEVRAERAQRLAQLPEIRQRGELIEGGDLLGHGDRLSGGQGAGNPQRTRKVQEFPAFLAVNALAYQPLPCPG
jgi:hypothetical protein